MSETNKYNFKLDQVSFFSKNDKSTGIRVMVFDPESMTMVDKFFYNNFDQHICEKLYKVCL